ncbi:MAG TPA: hypothetical protein PK536_13625 [Ignavibacteria bacterium]|nr:hypothetical protein [Ignavibacteria bacterium]HRK00283.1 hypothetical protein [Ignavibacteria bacterium]
MKIYFDKSSIYYNAFKYIFEIFLRNKKINFNYTLDLKSADFIISNTSESDLQYSEDFFDKVYSKEYEFDNFFKNDCFVKNSKGEIDYLCTAFYMINCIQEYGCFEPDEYGRFKYKNSYQYFYKNVEDNIVQQCFDKLFNSNEKLNKLKQVVFRSKFFLSHDIDTVYGSFFQDGFYALKRKKFDVIIKLIMNVVILKHDWLNIDKIIKIESEYDFNSVFYWLVNKGKLNKLERNSDYSIDSKNIRSTIEYVNQKGWENGIHKSISEDSFETEILKLGFIPDGNRYHYLKFNLPSAFNQLQQSGIKLDSSLGFADVMGFRNNYGQPFYPFDFNNNRAYDFVEVPLNVMDQTFYGYEKLPPGKIAKKVISFFEKNNSNSIISVLWHNNFFSNYKFNGYLDAYKEILKYFYENKYECITQSQIIKNKY